MAKKQAPLPPPDTRFAMPRHMTQFGALTAELLALLMSHDIQGAQHECDQLRTLFDESGRREWLPTLESVSQSICAGRFQDAIALLTRDSFVPGPGAQTAAYKAAMEKTP